MTITTPFSTETARTSKRSTETARTSKRTRELSAAPRRLSPLTISPYGSPERLPIADFEVSFRERLTELNGGVEPPAAAPRRSVITALTTAVRGGITADRLLAIAAGLSAADLIEAYEFVDRTRRESSDALDELFADPTVECFERVGPAMSGLLPHAAAYLGRTAAATPDGFASAVRHLQANTGELEDLVTEIDRRLRTGEGEVWTLLAQRDDGCQSGVFCDPSYRPRRIGDITPIRLAILLGEQPGSDER